MPSFHQKSIENEYFLYEQRATVRTLFLINNWCWIK